MSTLIFHETVDSTNEEAKRLIDAGATTGTVVVARHQSAADPCMAATN